MKKYNVVVFFMNIEYNEVGSEIVVNIKFFWLLDSFEGNLKVGSEIFVDVFKCLFRRIEIKWKFNLCLINSF